MRVFPHLFYVDVVVRALFQALVFQKMQRLHMCVCSVVFSGCAQAMHFKCFGQTQWKQRNENSTIHICHVSP